MSSSSHLILLLSTFSTILFHFFIIFMLMSNWYMINTFVLNLTATVFIFVICKLTYCIEFTKFVDLIFSIFDQ